MLNKNKSNSEPSCVYSGGVFHYKSDFLSLVNRIEFEKFILNHIKNNNSLDRSLFHSLYINDNRVIINCIMIFYVEYVGSVLHYHIFPFTVNPNFSIKNSLFEKFLTDFSDNGEIKNLVDDVHNLSEKNIQILFLFFCGFSRKEISKILKLTYKVVVLRMLRISKKYNIDFNNLILFKKFILKQRIPLILSGFYCIQKISK